MIGVVCVLQRSYHYPLISTQCWHVHCQQCWIRCLVCIARLC